MCEGLLLLVLVMVLILRELLGLRVVVVGELLLVWVGLICKVVSWELRVLTKIY
jgi:hypothetical protein